MSGDELSNDVEELRTLTVRQFAAASRIQEWRVRELLKAGVGPPHFRVGRVIRIPLLRAREWLDKQTNTNRD